MEQRKAGAIMEALFGIGHASIVKDFVEMGALATFFVLTLALL